MAMVIVLLECGAKLKGLRKGFSSTYLFQQVSTRYRGALRAAAKEAGFSYGDVLTAIDIYAERCANSLHQRGLQQLGFIGEFKDLAEEILADEKSRNNQYSAFPDASS
jgi:molybdenum-dependent DNA-binding transcriptional regulator ModE